jgi:hypothetical protein
LWFLNVVLHIAVVRVAPLLVAIERCAPVRKSSAVLFPTSSSTSPRFALRFRLQPPQRGLIATAENQKQLQQHEARLAMSFDKPKATAGETPV